jgi:3',5'-cyclic AMP phosphodiesterase CpdA
MCVLVILSMLGTAGAQDGQSASTYSFVYLGDLHFDQKTHHDLEWVKAKQPGDLRQIEDYVRNTQEYTPGLLQRIRTAIDAGAGRIKMVVQGGDLTEGLCGSRELQETQFRDAAELIRRFLPETPFLAAKGNHDITGPGAREAFDSVMLPWLARACGKPVESASFHFSQGPDLFVFFDAYHNNNLDWLEKTLRENPHRHVFLVMHPPAVPYDARSTWHLFSRDNEQAVRERFLNILGTHRVVLLTGHLHKFGVLVRRTSTGAFVQFAMSSVISKPRVSVKNHLEGVQNYGGRLVELEPDFQPQTLAQRRTLLEREKPHIARFEHAELAGYAIFHVSDAGVRADIYLGDSEKPWKTVPLTPGLAN